MRIKRLAVFEKGGVSPLAPANACFASMSYVIPLSGSAVPKGIKDAPPPSEGLGPPEVWVE